MPSIKYKKKTYAGATFPVLEMTKAEYDALPEAKKMDGTVYMITDDTGGWEAENSSYDNTESGLTATNVQDALDEIDASVDDLNSKTGRWQSTTLATETFGTMSVISNSKLKLAFIYWVGNGTVPSAGERFITLPAAYKPVYGASVPLRNGDTMEVRLDGRVKLVLTATAWSGGAIMYPLA